jgi:hypothetical protein
MSGRSVFDKLGYGGLRNRQIIKIIAVQKTPTMALMNRGASPWSVKLHQRSFEYIMCLKENRPNQIEQSSTSRTAAIQPGLNLPLIRDPLR